jgi:hypothetical protein
MTTDNFYPKRALMVTRMIFFSQIAGSLLFLILVYYLNANNFIFETDLSDPLFLPLFFLCLVLIPAGYYVSRRKLARINPSGSLSKKYQVFQIALIIRLATCEGIALFSVACLLITNNLFYILFFLIAIAVMILNYPSPDRIGKEITLTQAEIETFY